MEQQSTFSSSAQGYYGRTVVHQHMHHAESSAVSTAQGTPTHRPTTPEDASLGHNPFRDGVESQASHRSGNGPNPFSSPAGSRPGSSVGTSSALGNRFDEREFKYFHSRRVRKGEVEKPWLQKKDPKEKWVTILPLLGILIGLGVSGVLVWDGIRSVVKHKYCPVLEENWSQGFREDIWTKEVQVGGFGNGEFEQTTGGNENVFIDNGRLIIKASLQDDTLIKQNNVIDLLKDGTCTGTTPQACIAATNTTSGNATIVPPTKSGRINTKKGATIKYGRVEVTAKLPLGDWLWPAIWMMPVEDTYGPWPASGEIDICESRGNDWTYAQGGNNIVSSALHWGPNPANDAWWRTNNKRQALRTTYSAGFNTFGVEWSQRYIFTYINSRLLQVMYTNFDQNLWRRGNFPQANSNGTLLRDPWTETGRPNTPFDQRFYLILSLAVGGTNGWFEDGKSNKPWLDGSPNAKKDFWDARDKWFPTWGSPQMEISKVIMWQQCDGDEEL